ncbi:SDR family oxidoreductase [Peribacillus cavernae]|uniref:SDR family oxidoreductase n=1 Tax=Peribacillus cavernae TaxID=1674310 RepID=A0A3S0UFA7_9BACI|nr:glucose 1-dehydrogenase [Peribacillus cavernae]MDQ0217282.1 NAD(P)-dependent dehydrogenase (short-subunit alcohol dehydrogenase family) [Peribacillus cavernae]RUQ30251.1 SDR family oxidoreductase [Peribacillus cavernae]
MSFSTKTVIVTGAGSGIGKAVALDFGKEGANVLIAELDEKTGSETAEQIHALGGRSLFVRTDVRSEVEIKHAIDEAVRHFGSLDILINNAGVSKFKPLFDLSVSDFDDILAINLRSVFIASKEAAKVMKPGSAIVNMSSTRAFMSEGGSEAYAASKGGIISLTHALAASLSESRIRVNSISPGWIETGDYGELTEGDHKQHWSKRVGKPSDIARACLYLCDEENDFVNGENVTIDGGMTRKMIYKE